MHLADASRRKLLDVLHERSGQTLADLADYGFAGSAFQILRSSI